MTTRILEDHGHPPEVDEIDLEKYPKGCIIRLNLVLIHGSLGQPVPIPVMIMRGAKPGPVFGVVAAVHGNEINGIPVIHRLFDVVDPRLLKGTILAVPVVNVPGFKQRIRGFDDGTDLNLIMPGREGGPMGMVYAARFCEKVIKHCDFLMDLHTASLGRLNSLYVRADMTHATTAQMAYLQRPAIILHNPPRDGTLRGHAMDMGIPSLTLEIGHPQRFHPEYIKRALGGLRAVLGEVGMIAKRSRPLGAAPVLCENSFWLYTDHGGLLEVFPSLTQMVKKDQVIARLSNIFGDVTKQYRAPRDSIVIGKSVNPVGQTGARIIHLGIVARDDHQPYLYPPP